MKKLFSLFALLAAFTFSAKAEDFSVANSDGDTIYYNITDATALTVEVTYDDNYSPNRFEESVWYTGAINIPSSVTYGATTYAVTAIGDDAFYNCTGLSSITIPASVTSIGVEAFFRCTGLSSITIPDGVTSIGGGAFYGCTGLTSITIPEGITHIGARTFDDTAWLNNQPDGVIYISNIIYDYKGVMPANTSIVVKDGITRIESYVFDNCTGLTSITIPESVTEIGYLAFGNCTGLTQINVEAITPPAIVAYTFNKVDRTIPVYVPMSSVAAYQTHEYWGEFSIQGVSSGPVTPTETVKPDEVNFIQNGNTISFSEEQHVSVYSINGVCVFSGITRDLQLTSRGTYIVVTASGSTKVII